MSTRREFMLGTSAVLFGANEPKAHSTAPDNASRMPALRTYKIHNTDLTVSRMAFGCAMLDLYSKKNPDFVGQTAKIIQLAYEQGIRFFDLADVYGANLPGAGLGMAETVFGQVLKNIPGMREQIVIQTKCGERFRDGGVVDNSREYIAQSVDGSLERLKVDSLDILLLHDPDSLVEPDEVAGAFDDLKVSGKVRYFGVSNHSPWQIEILKRSVRQPIIANQIQLGLAHWHTVPDSFKAALTHGFEGAATLDYCRAHDIQVQAYSPLKAGNLMMSSSLLNPAADASEETKHAAQALADIARKYDTSPAVIMLAWLLRHPAGIVPIIGGSNPNYLIENCTADRIELSREEWYALLHAASPTQPVVLQP